MNVTEEEKEELYEIIGRLACDCDVFAFGSRVTGTNRKFSDLDLAFILPDNKKMPAKQWNKLKYAFELSDLQFRVDIVDYNCCEDYFKKIIDGGVKFFSGR